MQSGRRAAQRRAGVVTELSVPPDADRLSVLPFPGRTSYIYSRCFGKLTFVACRDELSGAVWHDPYPITHYCLEVTTLG